MKRHKIGSHHSKRSFSRHGVRTHKFNVAAPPMRGGIRM